ncbi:hypothetical protein BJX63DRAFT_434815 [Aspergillus granulosus]|uniref:Ankyrin n=1 Tax=Aspergillus granulosus TaxID=176169 RepID=A0ABR4H317_9EURO
MNLRTQMCWDLRLSHFVNRPKIRIQMCGGSTYSPPPPNPLQIAIEFGQSHVVEYLLQHDFNVNQRLAPWKTGLAVAVQRNNIHTVRALLANGADVFLGSNFIKLIGRIIARESGAGIAMGK